jgi:predicted DNA-binding transcriptional regulator YafY
MDILILCLIVLMGWAAWIAFRPSSRRRTINANLHQHDGSLQKRDTLRDEPAELITIPEPNNRLLSADDERHAFKTGQPIWIRYKDTSGTVTERVVEIYRPRDDEVIYTWCRRKQAPRTFVRRNIHQWRLLPERFDFDPIVAQYWDEEGTRDRSEKAPWNRWLRRQPKEIADRYKYQ